MKVTKNAGPQLFAAIILCALSAWVYAADGLDTQVNIPHELFRLDNGLTVLVHSDHSTPTVFVGMWYGVGSKDEPDGKTGFAAEQLPMGQPHNCKRIPAMYRAMPYLLPDETHE